MSSPVHLLDEALLTRFRALPDDVLLELERHGARLESLPEERRSQVQALAILSYLIDVLELASEHPDFGVYSFALDQAYQTLYGRLLDRLGSVPGLEEVVASLPANLADWAELHEAGLTTHRLLRIQSKFAGLAARLLPASLTRLVQAERSLVLGHLLGFEEVLTSYRRAAAERIHEVRRRLGLLNEKSHAEPAEAKTGLGEVGTGTGDTRDPKVSASCADPPHPAFSDPTVIAVLQHLRGQKRAVAAAALKGQRARAIYEELQGTVRLETIGRYWWEFRTQKKYKPFWPYLCQPDEDYARWGRQAHS